MKSDDVLSVIVPALIYNRQLTHMFTAFIKNLCVFTDWPIEIIVIHQFCQLGPNEIKALLRKDDIYIPNEKNNSVSQCYNQGLEQAHGDYICLMATDVFVHQDWFVFAKEALDKNIYDIFIPYMYRHEESYKSKFREAEKTGNFYTDYSLNDGLCSCSVFKKETIKNIGEFDENLWVFQDRDYLLRVQEKGLRYGSHLKSLATHLIGMTRFGDEKLIDKLGWNEKKYTNTDIEYFNKKWGKNP